jgi:hypothetical protein
MRGVCVRTHGRRRRFLRELQKTLDVKASCEAAAMGRSAAYAWRREDAVFAADWDKALAAGTEERKVKREREWAEYRARWG